jgi:hypothetical protein
VTINVSSGMVAILVLNLIQRFESLVIWHKPHKQELITIHCENLDVFFFWVQSICWRTNCPQLIQLYYHLQVMFATKSALDRLQWSYIRFWHTDKLHNFQVGVGMARFWRKIELNQTVFKIHSNRTELFVFQTEPNC